MLTEKEHDYITKVTELETSPVGRMMFRLADGLNSKAAALLTHVSIMIAVSSVLFSYSLGPAFKRDVPPFVSILLLFEIVTYSLTSLLCLYAVQMTGPGTFRRGNGKALERMVVIVRRRRKAYRAALTITIIATLVLIGAMAYLMARGRSIVPL